MKGSNQMNWVLISYFLLFLIPCSFAFADDDKHEEKYFAPVNNETFKQECGACHFAYQPGLLPAGSWQKILSNLPSHFGEEVSLGHEQKERLSTYLQANAAENSSAKRARKILKSLRGQTPLRITETPYIVEKHHKLDPSVFARPSVGSRSQCNACHPKAEQGNYDDDFVNIPN